MNPHQRKIFGIIPLWAAIISLGCLLIFASAALCIYFKENLRERILKANEPSEKIRFQSESERLEIQIKLAEDQINSEKKMAELQDFVPKPTEEKESNNRLRNEKIKKLENQISELKTKKEEAIKKESEPKRGDWSENYNTEGLFGTATVGITSLICIYLAVFMRINSKPEELLTALDKRALMFLAASIFGAIFVFLLFAWYLSVFWMK